MESYINRWYHPEKCLGSNYDAKRSAYIDNLKFVLILLVVIGHFSLKLAYVKEIKYLLYYIYIFHMPCFVFVNGYLSKRMNAGGKLRVDKIFSVFIMYLVFKVGNVLLGYAFGQHEKLSLFKDASAPWYLLVLCIWYLCVPLLERIKPRYLIPSSFLIGILAGYVSCLDEVFSLSRVFVFYPFFIIGFCLSQDKLENFLNRRLRVPAFLFIIITFGLMSTYWKHLIPLISVIYGTSPYKQAFGDLARYGFLIRGTWYLLSLSLSIALILLVPRCKMFFTVLGERTMQIYMTHIWVRNALVYTGFFVAVKASPRYVPVIVLFGSVILTFLLANKWLKKLFDMLMSPGLVAKLIKKD